MIMPANTSLEIPEHLQRRMELAMRTSETSNASDFIRHAIIERCRRIEHDLRTQSPTEYVETYSGEPYFVPQDSAK